MPVSLSKFAFGLTAANSPVAAPIGGTFIRCIASGEDFEISFDGGPSVPLGVGRAIAPKNPDGSPLRFEHVAFIRGAVAALAQNDIEVVYGHLDYFDDRLSVLSGATIRSASAATLSGANPDVVLVAATNTQLLAANATRRCARIRNTHATAAVRLSSAAADLTAGRGELLNPGEVVEMFVTGAIHGRSAGTPTLIISEEVF